MTLLAVLLLSGCGFKDIDKRFFVVSVGVDLAQDSPKKYTVSLKFAVTIADKKSSDFIIISQNADTIAEAVRMIKTKVDKEVDFSHAKVIIFSDQLVKKNMAPHLYYWFTRRRDFQEIAWVAIGKPSALDVLKVNPISEQYPSNALFLALGREGSETPYVITQYLFDMKKKFTEKGLDPLLPIIEVRKDFIEINKVGLFNKERLKLSLSQEETKMLNFFLRYEEKSALKIGEGKEAFIIDTEKVKVKYKIYTDKEKQPFIKVDVKIKGRVEEAFHEIRNKNLPKYQNVAEKSMNKEISKLLGKLQKTGVDPIGFGLRYRSRHFNQDDWEEWKRLYPSIAFKVNTDVQIEDTGLVE